MKTRMKTTKRLVHPPGESSMEKETVVSTQKKKSKVMDEHTESHNRLHMLAAVASHHLRSDPTMKPISIGAKHQKSQFSSNIKFSSCDSELLQHKRKRTPCKKAGEGELLSIEQIRELSAHHLLKCFSDFDGNELRRTFTYSCVLDPTRCQKKFSSFGSELKARQQMKNHLLEHVNELSEESVMGMHFKAETVQSRQRRQVDAALLTKKKKFRSLSQPMKVSPIKEENKQKYPPISTNNCSTENHFSGDIKPELRLESIASSIVKVNDEIVENPSKSFLSICKDNSSTSMKTTKIKVEDINGSMKRDVEVVNPVALLDHNYVMHDNSSDFSDGPKNQAAINKTQEWNSEKNDYVLKNAIKLGNEEKFKYTSPELNKFMVSETLHDMIMVCVLEEEKLQLKQLPCVGSEMDVKTGQSKEAASKKVMESESEEESREIKIIHNNIERDEYRMKKKPKGKAKFIGQSKAEKEMAIQMIEAIKSRVTTLESLECQICNPPRSFTAPTTLISHYRSHAGIKPYECRLCRSVFTRQHSLNYHMLIHSNQTRFTCTDCGRKFRHPSHFKEHRRRHTGESPYECSDCMFRFKTRNTYKRHMRTHHGKLLTPSGELLLLSEEEFKQARALPRVPGKSSTRIAGKGRNSDSKSKSNQNEKKVCEDDEMDFVSHESDCSETHSDSNQQDDVSNSFVKVDERGIFKESNKENNGKIEVKERQFAPLECKTGNKKAYYKDIVKEAMRQSDIPFSSDIRSCENEIIIPDPLEFPVTEVVDSTESGYSEVSIKEELDVDGDELQESMRSNLHPNIVSSITESQKNDSLSCIYLNAANCVTLDSQAVEMVCGTSFSNNASESIKKEQKENQEKTKSTMLLFKPLIVNQDAAPQNVIQRKSPISSPGNTLPQSVSILTCQPVNSLSSDSRVKEGQAGKKIIIRAESTLIDAFKNQTLMFMNNDTTPQISLCSLNNHSLSVKNGVFSGEATQL